MILIIILAILFLLLVKKNYIKNKYFVPAILLPIILYALKRNIIIGFISLISGLSYVIFEILKLNKLKFKSKADYMPKSEAAAILGIDENSSIKEINEAYHNLMYKIHPDKGGNSYLANQITNAYKTLIKH